MKAQRWRLAVVAMGGAALLGAGVAAAAPTIAWNVVVNNGTAAPAGEGVRFFSYNQPSVNDDGLVVFRARARGRSGAPLRGVFARDMASGDALTTIAANGGTAALVPQPNNLAATFTEFPSFPRLDARSDTVSFRGQSNPVFEYEVSPDVTTRSGTSGVYANPGGTLLTGASQLGNVGNPDLSHFQVPGAAPATRFDQFPGAPSPTGGTVVFKGNWTDPIAGRQTGIFYRDTAALGGLSPVQRIAGSGDAFDSDGNGTMATFGSTAPPSASAGRVAFTGLDDEAAPTAGGIFVSSLADPLHRLTALVRIGVTSVGNGIAEAFRTVGEALSFDGGRVGFWGSWGSETRSVTVQCPSDGNAALLAACRSQDDNGTPNDGIYVFDVPAHQGIFVVDADAGALTMRAQTGSGFDDFLFWAFSGAPDSAGDADADQEPPRWRSSAFIAVDDDNVVFKGLADTDRIGLYGDLGSGLVTILETGMDGGLVDPAAAGLPITALGIERDGFRNGWLAISAAMADEESSWAGVYVARTPEPGSLALALGALALGATCRRRRSQ